MITYRGIESLSANQFEGHETLVEARVLWMDGHQQLVHVLSPCVLHHQATEFQEDPETMRELVAASRQA